MENTEVNYYIGVITKVVNDDEFSKEYHVIEASIPGIADDIRAFPKQGELDEPRVGDHVLLASFDPLFHSYFIYSKLKENDFIGVRASGKMVDITPEAISISVYKEESENQHGKDRPKNFISEIKSDKDGNIEIEATKDITIKANNITIDATKITMRGGYNSGLVNVGYLKKLLVAISTDLKAAGCSVATDSFIATGGLETFLEDKDIKH